MSIVSKKETFLDDEQSFKLWVELGSTKKVAEHFTKAGFVNPRTQKPFTPMAVWDSAMRWVLHNPDEARTIYLREGSMQTQEEWERWLVTRATHVLGTSRARFFEWIRKNGFEKYEDVYRDKYPRLSSEEV